MSFGEIAVLVIALVGAFALGWNLGHQTGHHKGRTRGEDDMRSKLRSELKGSGLGVERDYALMKVKGRSNLSNSYHGYPPSMRIGPELNNHIQYSEPFIVLNPAFLEKIPDESKQKIEKINKALRQYDCALLVSDANSYDKYVKNLERARQNARDESGAAFFSDSLIKYHDLVEQGLAGDKEAET